MQKTFPDRYRIQPDPLSASQFVRWKFLRRPRKGGESHKRGAAGRYNPRDRPFVPSQRPDRGGYEDVRERRSSLTAESRAAGVVANVRVRAQQSKNYAVARSMGFQVEVRIILNRSKFEAGRRLFVQKVGRCALCDKLPPCANTSSSNYDLPFTVDLTFGGVSCSSTTDEWYAARPHVHQRLGAPIS